MLSSLPVDLCRATRYTRTMIGSFKHRGLKRLFEEDDPRKLPPDMVDRIRAILARLHQAEAIEDMNVHSYRLHPLKGSRKAEWGVTVRANWRMTFRFEEGYALDVNLEDYQ
jgi:proteic killer suppression protein